MPPFGSQPRPSGRNSPLKTFVFALAEGLSGLTRRWGLTLAFALGLGISLALLFLFSLTIIVMEPLIQESKDHLEFSIFLRDDINDEGVESLQRKIQIIDPGLDIHYVSKQDALHDESLQAEIDVGEYLRLLGGNPLPPSLRVSSAEWDSDPGGLEKLITQLQSLPDVDEVSEDAQAMLRLSGLFRLIRTGSLFLGCGLVFCLILMLFQGMDRMFSERRRDRFFLRAVGGVHESRLEATLIAEGTCLGIMGGGVAAGVVALVLGESARVMSSIVPGTWNFLFPVDLAFLPAIGALACLAAGTAMGLATSLWLSSRHV